MNMLQFILDANAENVEVTFYFLSGTHRVELSKEVAGQLVRVEHFYHASELNTSFNPELMLVLALQQKLVELRGHCL